MISSRLGHLTREGDTFRFNLFEFTAGHMFQFTVSCATSVRLVQLTYKTTQHLALIKLTIYHLFMTSVYTTFLVNFAFVFFFT